MPRDNAHLRFLRDPDQDARRAELEAFVGHNPAPFLKQYDRLRERPEKPGFGAMTSFVAMAFFLGPCWFFYRRMWAWGWVLVVLLIGLGFVPGSSRLGVPVAVALGLLGRYTYLSQAFGRIEKLRGGAAVADLETLRKAGGVSKWAGWTSAIIYAVVVVLAIVAMFAFLSSGGNIDELR